MFVGSKLKEIRKKKNLTQNKLAEKCNMYESQIRKYETGKANPKIETIQKIAAALGVHYYDFYDSPSQTPEIAVTYHQDDLGLYRNLLDNNFISKNKETFELLNSMQEEIDKGLSEQYQDINDIDFHYEKLAIKHSHMMLEYLLKDYVDYDVSDLVELLSYYLKLTDNSQHYILELFRNISEDMFFKGENSPDQDQE